jgi:hypothetical protein
MDEMGREGLPCDSKEFKAASGIPKQLGSQRYNTIKETNRTR